MARDERKFEDVVSSIVKAQSDVDRILEAAKLERTRESAMTGEQRSMVAVTAIVTCAIALVLVVLTVMVNLRAIL